MNDFRNHFSHYFSLIGIILATIIGFAAFSYDKDFQLAIVTASSVSYFVWGVVHHILHRNLNVQIIIEYATVAFLGFIIGVSVIYRA